MKMNKIFACLSALALGLGLTACGGQKEQTVGLGYTTSYEFDADKGVGTATVTAAMVAFEGEEIVDAMIDVVQVKIAKGAEINLVALDASSKVENGYVKTKLELGKDYGMLAAWGSQLAEVDNQIEAYTAWTIGKTAAQVGAALAAREGGHYEGAVYTSDDALWAQCTITCNGFAAAVEKAWANKTAASFGKGALAGLSLIGNVSEKDHGKGNDQVSVDMAGVMAKDGKVEACLIDAITFSFAAEGEGFKHDDTTKYYEAGKSVSKKDLGDKYAMADRNHPAYSNGCTYEWYEQAASFETFCAGKTPAQIEAADKIEGCTITRTAYVKAVKNAVNYSTLEHVGPQH